MKPKILIQALVLLLFTFSTAFGEPPETETFQESPSLESEDAAVPEENSPKPDLSGPASDSDPDSLKEKASPDGKIPAQKSPEAESSPEKDPSEKKASEEESSKEESNLAESDEEESAPKEKPKSILEIRTEALFKFVNEEVQNTNLEQEKKTQLRAMVMAAYRDNHLKPLWSEAEEPFDAPPAPVVPELGEGEEGEPEADLQAALPQPIDPADLEKVTALEKFLTTQGFEETALSFHPRPRVSNPDCPVPLHDLTLTLALAEVCFLLKQGPESVSEWPNWMFGDEPVAVSSSAYFKKLAERFGEAAVEHSLPAQVAESFVPRNWVYHRILDEIHREKVAPEPPQIEIEGLIKVGNKFPDAIVLADFLMGEGLLVEEDLASIDGVFTKTLSDALREYQETKNLQSDGILGPSTVRKITGSNEDEREQLHINLHRARRLPDEMGEKYVLANIPSGELHGFENGEEAIRMRIVFGKHRAGFHTPLFRDKMENVVFRPYWNVPYSISVNESMYSNPDYLSRNGFQIVSSSGASLPINYDSLNRVGQRKAFIRQNGGTSNALGLVKFLFPNPHSVYFHDTPAKHYFSKSYRAQSHGCVRIQKPEEMANWVLKDSEKWDAGKIKYAMHSGGRTPVDLEEHIPVYIAYFSAFPDPKRDEGVGFYNDVYNYDRPNAVVDVPGPRPRPRTNLGSDEKKRPGFFLFRSKNKKGSGGGLFDRLRGNSR